MRIPLFVAVLCATPASADYSGHRAVTLFTEKPCTQAVAAIDRTPPSDNIDALVLGVAEQGMAWGFLLGFDTAAGGLDDGKETTLTRLRDACADSPKSTAVDLLRALNHD